MEISFAGKLTYFFGPAERKTVSALPIIREFAHRLLFTDIYLKNPFIKTEVLVRSGISTLSSSSSVTRCLPN